MATSYGFFKGIDTTTLPASSKGPTVAYVQSSVINRVEELKSKTTIMSTKVANPAIERGVATLQQLNIKVISAVREEKRPSMDNRESLENPNDSLSFVI